MTGPASAEYLLKVSTSNLNDLAALKVRIDELTILSCGDLVDPAEGCPELLASAGVLERVEHTAHQTQRLVNEMSRAITALEDCDC